MTDTLTYTDPDLVTQVKFSDPPLSGQTVSGYGGKIPTRYMLRYAGRWHRVYMMQYGNSGSPYLLKGGAVHHLDIDTTHRIEKHRPGAGPDVRIDKLAEGDRFRFQHDGIVATLRTTTPGGMYSWSDYGGGGRLYAPGYDGYIAWPYVYPTEDPETHRTANGEHCAEFEENGSCIHSDHTR